MPVENVTADNRSLTPFLKWDQMKRNKEQQIVFQRKEADESIDRSRLERTLLSPILQRCL